jgi:hypothetical protein
MNGGRKIGAIHLNDKAPDGFVVRSFAGDDSSACRDLVQAKLGLPKRKPNGRNWGGNGESSTCLWDEALNLARGGVPVFPCINRAGHPDDKRPLTTRGFYDAT